MRVVPPPRSLRGMRTRDLVVEGPDATLPIIKITGIPNVARSDDEKGFRPANAGVADGGVFMLAALVLGNTRTDGLTEGAAPIVVPLMGATMCPEDEVATAEMMFPD